MFDEDSEHTDVPPLPGDVARGRDQIAARLKLGLEPISEFGHRLRPMVEDCDAVMTEHEETWTWHTGEVVTLPLVSIQELRDGTITRWWDYRDL
ncbi:MAG: nuclear transport factor 2 family protein, partial [Acidimicrobiales bacterium]